MTDYNSCSICEKPAKIEACDPLNRILRIMCDRCSVYQVTEEASAHLNRGYSSQRFKVSAYLRERQLLGEPPITLVSSKEAAQKLQGPVVDIDTTLERFPTSVQERLDKCLLNLSRLSEYPGARCRISLDQDYPIYWAENPQACWSSNAMLKELGWITGEGPMGHIDAIITARGWNRLSQIQTHEGRANSKQVFIAMSFHDSLTSSFENGMKKAVREAGFEPLRVDLKEHNDKICDVIISEIRRSRFLIADFTGHRAGVYFEAGFALGLGLPVIWTCREDDIDNAHFDTRQYNHIVWMDEADLCQKLSRRIKATIDR